MYVWYRSKFQHTHILPTIKAGGYFNALRQRQSAMNALWNKYYQVYGHKNAHRKDKDKLVRDVIIPHFDQWYEYSKPLGFQLITDRSIVEYRVRQKLRDRRKQELLRQPQPPPYQAAAGRLFMRKNLRSSTARVAAQSNNTDNSVPVVPSVSSSRSTVAARTTRSSSRQCISRQSHKPLCSATSKSAPSASPSPHSKKRLVAPVATTDAARRSQKLPPQLPDLPPEEIPKHDGVQAAQAINNELATTLGGDADAFLGLLQQALSGYMGKAWTFEVDNDIIATRLLSNRDFVGVASAIQCLQTTVATQKMQLDALRSHVQVLARHKEETQKRLRWTMEQLQQEAETSSLSHGDKTENMNHDTTDDPLESSLDNDGGLLPMVLSPDFELLPMPGLEGDYDGW